MIRSILTSALAISLGAAPLALSRAHATDLTVAVAQSIRVPKNKSEAFHLDGPAGRIVVAQPEIAEIVATTDQSFYVRGKAIGATNILVYDHDLHLQRVIDVTVGYDAPGLQRDLALALPGEHVTVTSLDGGILLSGEVSTNTMSERALALAELMAPKAVTSAMSVRTAQQVLLDVRIVEVNKSALEDFGINLNGQSNSGSIIFAAAQGLIGAPTPSGTLSVTPRIGGGSLTVTLQALEQKGLARTLAKPSLTALPGQEASFLAGGEIPVPVPNGLQGIGIDYKQFGVQLKFTPTIQPDGVIRLKVAPEVSELDKADGVSISGFQVPAFAVRKASTTVELRDGQSFAVAGLFQSSYSDTLNQLPGVRKLPVLGALFRSTAWQKNQTELVIIVTPHMVASDQPLAPEPGADSADPSAIDVILQGLEQGQKVSQAQPPSKTDLSKG